MDKLTAIKTLISIARQYDVGKVLAYCQKEQYIGSDCLATDKGLKFISNTKEKTIKELAEDIRKIFPAIRTMAGTNYRCSVQAVEIALNKFGKEYNIDVISRCDDIIQATKNYIRSFYGNYTLLRTAVNFIDRLEVDPTTGEMIRNSALLSELANLEDQEEYNADEWANEDLR